MVSLALLTMLAVFAALFLTSSRFDLDAATADLDAARMDLYAEGLAQYVQTCMVAGLWGFDDKPLNWDGVISTSTEPLARCPGPDAPYTYFGGRAQISPPAGTAYWYYPNFWLTDPEARLWPDPTLSTGLDGAAYRVYPHPAFAPPPAPWRGPTALPDTLNLGARAALPPFFQEFDAPLKLTAPNQWTAADRAVLRWRFADLDGDGRPDTPWLFYRPLGNNLYIRAAVHVEDTSSRINANVADHQLRLEDAAATDNYWWPALPAAQGPTITRAESLRRMTTYKGYPWLGDWNVAATGITYSQSRFPLLPDDIVGRFLSELNLTGSADLWAGANVTDSLNWGNGTLPGRYGNLSPADVAAGGGCPPDIRFEYTGPTPPAAKAVPPNLAGLLGDPDAANPGRLGRVLEQQRLLPVAAGNSWDPTDTARWRTYDPDGLARRLESIRGQPGDADQDRPFGIDDTFEMMGLRGLFAYDAPEPPWRGEQRYRPGGGLPATTRLERLWPRLLVNSGTENHSLQWRRILTGYSWTLNLCPYGEDPYWVAHGSLATEPRTFRKVNLNTCTGDEFFQALSAANRHSLLNAGGPPPLSTERLNRITANFLGYRGYTPGDANFKQGMNAAELMRHLSFRLLKLRQGVPAAAIPPPVDFDFDLGLWNTYWTTDPGPGAPAASELAYLNWLFGTLWNNKPSFWNKMNSILAAGVSTSPRPQPYPASAPTAYGMARHPYIVELYASIHFVGPDDELTRDYIDPSGDPTKNRYNRYGLELYNPWDTAIDLTGWYIRTRYGPGGTSTVDLTGFVIGPYGRFVITRWNPPTATPAYVNGVPFPFQKRDDALVVAGVPGYQPTIELLYRGAGQDVVYDRVGRNPDTGLDDGWTAGFDGQRAQDFLDAQTPQPPAQPYEYGIARRDDNGFWCYQRWAVQHNAYNQPNPGQVVYTLGAPTSWFDSVGAFQPDPWDATTYGPNPAVPRIGVGQILSPAELALIPYDAPDDASGTPVPLTLTEIITPFTALADPMPGSAPLQTPTSRFEALRFGLPMLFHYDYTLGLFTTGLNSQVNQTSPSKGAHSGGFAGVFQALMDFVTVDDYTADWIDSQGNTTAAQPPLDRTKMRVPGRLNVNTVRDWNGLDQMPFLAYLTPRGIDSTVVFADTSFWHRLTNYRDRERNDPTWFWIYMGQWHTRRLQTPGPPVRDCAPTGGESYFASQGFEQLGEICNVMVRTGTSPTFEGLWQRPTTTGLNPPRPLLPPQYMRKFMGNVNLLTTRGDTFMVTLRVEIVRATSNAPGAPDPLNVPNGLVQFFGTAAAPRQTQVTVLGQKEYMYLIDRSYCAYPPQRPPVGLGSNTWGTLANPLFNGQANPDFVPPRVWRMSVPRYAAYGG